MPLTAVALAALLCGAAASALAAPARRIAQSSSHWLHPAVPAIAASVLGAAGVAVAQHWAVAVALAALAVGCGLLIAVDLAVFRLPDALVWPTTGAVAGMLLVAAALTSEWARLGTALLAMLVVGAGYFALAWIAPSSLGLGDVKLSIVLGLTLGWFGWRAVVLGVMGGFVLFALLALAMLALRRTSLRADLPFGPWMILGAAAGLGLATVGA